MGKGPRTKKPKEDDEPMIADSDIEEADIEALARSQLKEGEVILGDRAEEDSENATRGVLNKPMINRSQQDIEYKVPEGAKRVPWIDTLSIESNAEVPKGISAKDGVKLEGALLQLAADAAKEAYRRLRVMKVPCTRPTDFYAEMMRPDNLMYKVRAWASEETRRIGIVEDRKKAQAAKKFSKKAKAEKLKQRAKEKQSTLDDIAEWRTQSKRDGKNATDQDLEDILNRTNAKKRGEDGDKGKGKGKGDKKPKKSFKAKQKDEKWGFGGKKSGKKRNDAKSSRSFDAHPSSKKGKGKGKGGGLVKKKGYRGK